MKTSGYREKRRPRKRWIESDKETLSKYNVTTSGDTTRQLLATQARALHFPPRCDGKSGRITEKNERPTNYSRQIDLDIQPDEY